MDPSAKNFGSKGQTSQYVIMLKGYKNFKPPEKASTKNIKVASCVKKESKAAEVQWKATGIIKIVESETTNTFSLEALFEVPPTEGAFSSSQLRRYKLARG